MIEISVIIPTWNGASRISLGLESLARQNLTPDRYEIVVVDDGSDDDLERVVGEFTARYPRLSTRFVRIDHSGVNAARNAGIANSRGRLVALFDDDEEAPPGYLELIVQLADEHPDCAGVGGRCRLKEAGFRTCASCQIGEASLPIAGAGRSDRLLGGNMAVRREVFDEVGLFDVSISGRGDETEWFHRAGRSFWYDEQAFIWHRRDHMSLAELLASGYRQGKSVPIAVDRMGGEPWQPSPRRMARYLAHGITKRCTNGLLQEARELGSLSTWVRLKVPDRRGVLAEPTPDRNN